MAKTRRSSTRTASGTVKMQEQQHPRSTRLTEPRRYALVASYAEHKALKKHRFFEKITSSLLLRRVETSRITRIRTPYSLGHPEGHKDNVWKG
jgi:hypothetical protein